MVSKNIYTTAFQDCKNLGLDPLPIYYDENGHPTKEPKISGWPIKAAKSEFVETDFVAPCNIGILLGGAKNLTDVDCDSPQAVAVAGDIIGHLMQKTGKT
jgi:hypothetical protein